jgi:hypothetical protein
VFLPGGALFDPAGEHVDLGGGERIGVVLGRRHAVVFVGADDAGDHLRFFRVARDHDGQAGLAFAEHVVSVKEGNVARLHHAAVAGGAVFRENGAHVAVELDGRPGYGREHQRGGGGNNGEGWRKATQGGVDTISSRKSIMERKPDKR